MRGRSFAIISSSVAATCAMILLFSVWPGSFSGSNTTLSFAILAVVGAKLIFCLVLTTILCLRNRRAALRSFALHILLCAGVVTLTGVLVHYDAAIRLVFRFERPSLEQLVQNGATLTTLQPRKRVGIYVLDVIARDARGGTYFRTGTGQDMIDTMSYGFAYEPNSQGTPFGAAKLQLQDLGHGWFLFQASDDWD